MKAIISNVDFYFARRRGPVLPFSVAMTSRAKVVPINSATPPYHHHHHRRRRSTPTSFAGVGGVRAVRIAVGQRVLDTEQRCCVDFSVFRMMMAFAGLVMAFSDNSWKVNDPERF